MSPELISVGAARERVLSRAHPLYPEPVPIAEALDRTLAADVVARGDVPPFASSAMDGYAIQAGRADRTLTVVGESRAGAPADGVIQDGQAVRISTGAAVPAGASAVIPQEDVSVNAGRITTLADSSEQENIRSAGEVMRVRDLVLSAGTTIGPPELGAAVAAGAAAVVAYPRPRVAILCTGDELRQPGTALAPGEIHNSNGPMLAAYARLGGAVASDPLVLADDLASTTAALEKALVDADVVIVSGGVSVGPHDHVRPALAELGVHEEFWGVALQPGKPTWFGSRGRTLVFGLPGNPVSVAVTFSLFVAPGLHRLSGHSDDRSGTSEAQLAGAPVKRNRVREQALRVRLERSGGSILAYVNGPQGSHVITSLVGADALALIPPGEGEVEIGTTVALAPLARYTLA